MGLFRFTKSICMQIKDARICQTKRRQTDKTYFHADNMQKLLGRYTVMQSVLSQRLMDP